MILLQAARPLLIDFAATLFFVVIAALTHDPLLATGVALLVAAAQLGWAFARRRRVGALQWLGFGLIVVFGSASLLTHDPRFMMFKPSVIYLLVGAVMFQRGWMLRYIPERALPWIGESSIVRWGYAWAALMLATAALNVYFALFASFPAWSRFVAIFPVASKAALFAVQYSAIRASVRGARQRADAQTQGEPPALA
jgi:intracellular septation protein A